MKIMKWGAVKFVWYKMHLLTCAPLHNSVFRFIICVFFVTCNKTLFFPIKSTT